MIDGVTLNGADVRLIVALFLGVPTEAVIPMKYSYIVNGMTVEEVKAKLEKRQ